MMTAIDAKAARRRHLFVVEGLDAADALLRVLGVVAVQARLAGATFDVVEGSMVARMEVEGLSQDRAEHLRQRLAQLPVVTGVSLGWRASASYSDVVEEPGAAEPRGRQ